MSRPTSMPGVSPERSDPRRTWYVWLSVDPPGYAWTVEDTFERGGQLFVAVVGNASTWWEAARRAVTEVTRAMGGTADLTVCAVVRHSAVAWG